jgi:hypothetical protein
LSEINRDGVVCRKSRKVWGTVFVESDCKLRIELSKNELSKNTLSSLMVVQGVLNRCGENPALVTAPCEGVKKSGRTSEWQAKPPALRAGFGRGRPP